jgi:hypothetical protein
MEYKCYKMNDNSGKAWALDTHQERIEGDTAAFTTRTTESDTQYISNIQIFIQTSRKKKSTRASLSTSHSKKRIRKHDHQ